LKCIDAHTIVQYYGYVHTTLHGVATQKTKISIFTAMKTSNFFLHMSMHNMSVKWYTMVEKELRRPKLFKA
jgi:hypothetical protein